jgi:hypothetical protein
VVIALDEQVDLAWAGLPSTRGRFWAVASGLHSRQHTTAPSNSNSPG